MANVSVKDWAQQRGYKDTDIKYDPKTKKISIAGVSYGEPTVKDGKSYMSEYDLDKVYGQQKLNQSETSNMDARTKYMNAVNEGYTPGVFQYDKNKDSAYAAAMSSSKAALDRNLLENRWAMESQGRAGGGYAMDRANKLIADENRRMQIEVVPALEDRALNRFNTGEAQKRQTWMDKVNALQAQYGITNDDVNRWSTRVNNAQTLGQNQTNWQATYDQTKEENKLNRDLQVSENKLNRDATATQNANQLKEQQRQFNETMTWNKSQAAAARAAGSAGGGSSGGSSGGSGSGDSGKNSGSPFRMDNMEDLNKIIASNKTLFSKNPITGNVSVKDEASRQQIATTIWKSRLPAAQKRQLFEMYGITGATTLMDRDNNFKFATTDPAGFFAWLTNDLNTGKITREQFENRLIYYGMDKMYQQYYQSALSSIGG